MAMWLDRLKVHTLGLSLSRLLLLQQDESEVQQIDTWKPGIKPTRVSPGVISCTDDKEPTLDMRLLARPILFNW